MWCVGVGFLLAAFYCVRVEEGALAETFGAEYSVADGIINLWDIRTGRRERSFSQAPEAGRK